MLTDLPSPLDLDYAHIFLIQSNDSNTFVSDTFAIDPSSGVITLTQTLDYDILPRVYFLHILAVVSCYN